MPPYISEKVEYFARYDIFVKSKLIYGKIES
jgi:hypothetical protein